MQRLLVIRKMAKCHRWQMKYVHVSFAIVFGHILGWHSQQNAGPMEHVKSGKHR
jgi:hypothetical protein